MTEKVAVVTGANKGIGFAITKGLCEKFDGIVYATARDVGRGKNAVKSLEELGFHPHFHQLDITDQASIAKFANYIKEKHGGLDVLVNNAGIAFKLDSTDIFEIQAETTVNVNYFALQKVCQGLFPLLRAHARVVNVSSSCGHLSRIPGVTLREKLGDPNLTEEQLSDLMQDFIYSAKKGTHEADGWGTSSYNVSKNGVTALSFIQQRELDKDTTRPGINVNAVHPGYVDTDMTSHKGEWTIEQGADAPLYLALLPESEDKIKGCYVWKDRNIVDWRADDTPGRY